MASVSADGQTPRMAEMEQMLRSLPPDQLSVLVGRVSPGTMRPGAVGSPSASMRGTSVGQGISPTRLAVRSIESAMPMELSNSPMGATGASPRGEKRGHHLRHAASTMYTERQNVDIAAAQRQYHAAAIRNGLKQGSSKNAEQWTTSYGTNMSAKDALDQFMTDSELNAAKDMDTHWGVEPGRRSVDTGGVDSVERALRAKLETFSGYRHNPLQTLSKIFVDYDSNSSGHMSEDEFVEAIALKLNFGDFKNELRTLFKRYDLDSSGGLSNQEFCDALFVRKDDGRRLVGKIREVLALRAGGFSTLRGMGRQFRILDRDKSNTLDQRECQRGLNMLCRAFKIHLNDIEATRLFQLFDYDGNGSINYDEFVRALRGNMNERRRGLVTMAFDCFQKDSWGRVTLKTIASCYDVSQHPGVIGGKITPTEALYEFMKKWDKDGDKTVTLEEFIDYYEWVSPNIDNDDYFELMIRNAWHVSGGTGWSQNTSCRRVLVEHLDGSQEIVEVKNDLGLGKDPEKIKRALMLQGVTSIKFIKLTA